MKQIGKYEILGLLGRGGMGHVYKVRVPHIGAIAALKLLKPVEHLVDVLGSAELERRFLHEARIMAGINHPHIARVWDFDRHQGAPFFTMEYACENVGAVIGESYRVEDPTRLLWPETAVRFTLQTLDALSRLHSEGVVHRDIKPFNLLLTPREEIRLIDFGLSRLRGEQSPTAPPAMKIGTPFYTAPEQERAPDSADARADLFSTGVLLFRLLTGVLPPEGGISGGASVFAPRAPFAGMDSQWEDFFRTALAPSPEDRFASADAMHTELSHLFEKWQGSLDNVCTPSLQELEEGLDGFCPVSHEPGQPGELRSAPIKTGPLPASEVFALDEMGRPLSAGEPRFAPFVSDTDGAGLVRSPVHGLVWQGEGSRWPGSWQQAHEYVRGLNTAVHGGRTNWRLPSVDELATLVRAPEQKNALCMPSVFSSRQRLLWSADRRSFVAAWHLNAGLGFIGWQDFTCPAWIRAVSSEQRR